MRPVVIWGTGGLAEQVFFLNQSSATLPIVAFCANREYCKTATFMGLPLVADDELEKRYPPEDFELLVCIGFRQMNQFRESVCVHLESRGYSFCNFIHPTAIIHESAQLGSGNIICEGVLIGTHCKIGNGNVFLGGNLFSHDITVCNYCHVALGAVFGGFVRLENNCFVGLNATILPHVTLSEKTLAGAGTVIAKDTAAYDVYSSARSILTDRKSTDVF